MALYTRRDLGIRTTANFLLAFSGFYTTCRPYLKKYFKQAIMLPSDWIEVAEIYQVTNCISGSLIRLPNQISDSLLGNQLVSKIL